MTYGTCTTKQCKCTEIICTFNPTHVIARSPSGSLLFWDNTLGNYYCWSGKLYEFADTPNSYGAHYLKVINNIVYVGVYDTGVLETWEYYIYN